MTKVLDVYCDEKIVGQLIQDKYGEINFTYSPNWLNNPNAFKISCSLPLQKETFRRKQCRGFFDGLLPEETQRKLIAKNLGISANNDFSMLEKIGGECAGALVFVTSGEKVNPKKIHYNEINSTHLADILRELPKRPLLAGKQGVRLSLAGVQDKIAVYIEDEKIFLPLDDSPSTHILKPNFTYYKDVIFNEAFCLKLAKQIGLDVAECEIKKIEDIYYLQVKRYDRIITSGNNNHPVINRVHQEDFCQAMNIASTKKYQNEGGPSLKQCFDLIRIESSVPVVDLKKMLDAVIFNFLIGNCDAHGKNFSLLYLNQIQFAPGYDLICTIYYKELSKKMAMKIGGEYRITHITPAHFDKLATEIGFAKPAMRKNILDVIERILITLPEMEKQHPMQDKVADIIRSRCEWFGKQQK